MFHKCEKCGHPMKSDEGQDFAGLDHDEAEEGAEGGEDDDVIDEALADLEADLDKTAAGRLPKGDHGSVSIEIVAGKPKKRPDDEDEDA